MWKPDNRRAVRWVLVVALVAGGGVPAALAQVVLESAANGALAGSGPAGTGPSSSPQLLTLRHNTDNPGGNAMLARTPAVTATFSLTNQQFTGLTPAEGYPSSTGGNGVYFGGSPVVSGGAPASAPLYTNLGAIGSPLSGYYTSVAASAGQGIDLTANAGVLLSVSTNAIAIRAPSTPLTARVRMADVVITFSAPVNNPILHLNGMGGRVSAPGGTTVQLGISTEFDLVTAGYSLTRLSGNTSFVVSGSQINNGATALLGLCDQTGACGSVRVNGTGITTLTLRAYIRGDGTAGTSWGGNPTSVNMDAVLLGVSVTEPTPTLTVRKVSTGGTGTFNFSGGNGTTGGNGYTATTVTTVTAGTAVDGTTRTLSAANTASAISEAATAGYRLASITCSGMGAGGTATPTLPAAGVAGGGHVVLDAAATALGSNIVCTFTNQRLPVIRLRKTLPNGRMVAGDQFTLRIANGATVLQSVTTTGSDGAPAQVATLSPAAVGTTYTLSEVGSGSANLANYTTTYTCTNALAGGQTPSGSGSSFTVTPVAGDDLNCTLVNIASRTDVSIAKTANATTRLPGQVVQFTLLVSNIGMVAAPGAQVRDPAAPGLDCTALSCTAAGAAACPAAPTITGLQSASGLTIPALPAGGSISLQLTCTVTASGFAP